MSITRSASDSRHLFIRFVVDSHGELSSAEFVSLFGCVDAFARSIAQGEISDLVGQFDAPPEARLALLQQVNRLVRRVGAPAEVRQVQRGSWVVDTLLSSAAIVYILKEFVGPTFRAAWDDSRMRDTVVTFLRDRAFLGSRRRAEETAAASERYGNLKVVRVTELAPPASAEPALEVGLERTRVLPVARSDHELIEEFMRRLERR